MKLFGLTVGLITLVSIKNIEASSYSLEPENVVTNYVEALSEINNVWENATLGDPVPLNNDTEDVSGYLYRPIVNGEQKGYVIVGNEESNYKIIESSFEGIDGAADIEGDVYYTTPSKFYTASEYEQILESNASRSRTTNYVEIASRSVDTSKLIPVPSAHYKTFSGSFTSYQQLLDTPSYLNYNGTSIGSPATNACGPTAAAMLIAFYDTVSLGTLYNGLLPQHHYEDPEKVNNLILELVDSFGTCSDMNGDLTDTNNCIGTSYLKAKSGLTNYFNNNNNGQYDAYYSTDYRDYQIAIANRSVSYLRLDDDDKYGNHAVLGIGTANVRYTGNMMIIRDNWVSDEVWVNADIFNGFIYMSK